MLKLLRSPSIPNSMNTPRLLLLNQSLIIRLFLIVFLICLFWSGPVFGNRYYWVGGSGNWSDISHWATASGGNTFHPVVPGANDTVYFDANSGFTPGNNVVTINTGATCHSMIWNNAPHAPVLRGMYNMSLSIFGSLELQSDMVMDLQETYFNLNFRSTRPGNTIKTNGVELSAGRLSNNKRWNWGGITFDGGGGEWMLLDDFMAPETVVTFIQGALHTGGRSVSMHGFRSETIAPKELHLGNSVLTIGYLFSTPYANFILDAGSSTMNFSGDMPEHQLHISMPGLVFHNINFLNPHVEVSRLHSYGSPEFNRVFFAGNAEIMGNNIFRVLEFSAGKTVRLQNHATQTVSDQLIAVAEACTPPIVITSDYHHQPAYIYKASGSVSCRNVILQDIHVLGGAAFSAAESIDLGNNNGWAQITEPGPKTLFWVGGGGNWGDGAHWSLSSGGAPSGCVPTPRDHVVFDAASGFGSAADTVHINSPSFCRDMRWEQTQGVPVLKGHRFQDMNIFGSLRLQSNMEVIVSQTGFRWNFRGSSAENSIVTAGNPLNPGYYDHYNQFNGGLFFSGSDTQWVLLDDLFAPHSEIHLIEGILNTNSQILAARRFYSTYYYFVSRGLILGDSEIRIDRSFQISGGEFSLDAGTSVINFSDGFSEHLFEAGYHGLRFHKVNFLNPDAAHVQLYGHHTQFHHVYFAGNAAIWGNNEFQTLEFSPGKSYRLESERVQTIGQNLIASSPVCTPPILLSSSEKSRQAYLFKEHGEIECTNIILEDIHATGGASFYARESMGLGDNNAGWDITQSTGTTLYWIGGKGMWDDGSNWSYSSGGPPAGCLPSPLDDVVFDVHSGFAPGADTLFINVMAYCRNMTWEGATGSPVVWGMEHQSLNIFGSLSLQEHMRLQLNNAGFRLQFRGSQTGNTISSKGQPVSAGYWDVDGYFRGGVYFDGMGASWTLLDDFSGDYLYLYLNAGSLNTNNQSLTSFWFESRSDAERELVLGGSDVYIEWWLGFSGTNFTVDAGTSTIHLLGWNAYADIHMPGLVLNDLNFVEHDNMLGRLWGQETSFGNVYFAGNGEIRGSNTFRDLIFSPGKNYSLESGRTQTITGDFDARGNPCFITHLSSSRPGEAAIINKITVGEVVADYITIKDIHAHGAADFMGASYASDLGNNPGWVFDVAPGDYIFGFGPDRILDCGAMPYAITTESFNPNPGTTYLWSDGSTGSELLIDDYGRYGVEVFYAKDCSVRDEISLHEPPVPTVDLGPDIYLPHGEATTLDAGSVAEHNYLWSTGETTAAIQVSDAGIYWVVVTNKHQCEAYDELIVYSDIIVRTADPAEITAHSALLGGEVLSDGGVPITQRGILLGREPDLAEHGTLLELGEDTGVFSVSVDALDPNTLYYVMAFATNSLGTTYGELKSFTTLASLPEVVTSPARDVTTTTALLGGEVISEGGLTVSGRGIYWGPDPDPRNNGEAEPMGSGPGSFSMTLEDLLENTTYYFIAWAENAEGVGWGEVESFATQVSPPEVVTSPALDVTTTTALLGGEVISDGGLPVSGRGIYWGPDPDPRNNGQRELMGSGPGSFSVVFEDLPQNATYYYIAWAENAEGVGWGEAESFTTLASPPEVVTSPALDVTTTTALLGGEVISDGGLPVSARGIYWGPDPDPLNNGEAEPMGSGTGSFSMTLEDLPQNVTYYYIAWAENAEGVGWGEAETFTTLASPPEVVTSPALDVTTTTALLGGEVISDGYAEVTGRGIYWGPDPDPSGSGVREPMGTGTGPFSLTLDGLQMNTTYYLRAYAVNIAGTAYGEVESFTTLASVPEVVTAPPLDVTSTTALLGGEVISEGGLVVSGRGIYWGPDPDPRNSGEAEPMGSGPGSFSMGFEGLLRNTTYYYIAWAENAEGVGWGEVETFATLAELPVVTTADPYDVGIFSASVGGEVLSEGGIEVSERGVYWGRDSEPGDHGSRMPMGMGVGVYSGVLDNLLSGTLYYVVAYAVNEQGVAYGETKSFVTDKIEYVTSIPNAFMPSSIHAENRVFMPEFSQIPQSYTMQLFNRWGQQVFSTTDPLHGWDGMFNNREAPPGSYSYRISYKDQDGNDVQHSGLMLLVR